MKRLGVNLFAFFAVLYLIHAGVELAQKRSGKSTSFQSGDLVPHFISKESKVLQFPLASEVFWTKQVGWNGLFQTRVRVKGTLDKAAVGDWLPDEEAASWELLVENSHGIEPNQPFLYCFTENGFDYEFYLHPHSGNFELRISDAD